MAQEDGQKKGKQQFVSIESILANSSDKSKLITFLDEAVRCKLRMADENEAIKGLREEAAEKLGLEPKLFNQLVKVSFNNSYSETRAEISALESAIEILFADKE